LEETFGPTLRLKRFPYGHGYGLDSGQHATIKQLIALIKPYADMVPSKAMRLDITRRISAKDEQLRRRFGANCQNKIVDFD